MVQKTWSGGSADWTQASHWGGTLPGPADDAFIPISTVSVTTNVGSVQTLTIASANSFADAFLDILGGKLAVSGQLTNKHRVQVGDLTTAGTLTAGTINNVDELDIGSPYQSGDGTGVVDRVTTSRLLNAGGYITLNGGSGSSTVSKAILQVNAPVGDQTAGELDGSYALSGDATVQFTSGQVTTINGAVSLTGASARIADAAAPSSNSALQQLKTIAGSLNLNGGATVATTGPLVVRGTLGVDGQTPYEAGGSQFTVTGPVTLQGVLSVGAPSLYNDARFTATTLTIADTGDLQAQGYQSGGIGGTARVAVSGAIVNSGVFSLAGHATATAGSFAQAGGFSIFGVNGTSAGQFGTLAVNGGVTLGGGIGYITTGVYAQPLAAGQSYTMVTFAPGKLIGQYDQLYHFDQGNRSGSLDIGSGTVVTINGGTLKAGFVYNDSAGTITLKVVAAPSTTVDTLTGQGSFGTASGWSAGGPTFYTDAVVASGVTATVQQDTTINSLTLGTGATVSSVAGSDLHIGATVAVAAGATLSIGGATVVSSAATVDGALTLARNATADLRGNAGGSGRFTLTAGSTLEFGAAAGSVVDFAKTAATLKLDHAYLFTGTLANLSSGASIDLLDTVAASASVSGNTLTVHKADTSTMTFALSGLQPGAGFTVQSDGTGGSRLVVAPAMPTFSGATTTAAAASGPATAYAATHPVATMIGLALPHDHAATSLLV